MHIQGRTAAFARLAGGAFIAAVSATLLSAQSGDKPANDKERRPSPSVRASPAISFSPARVHATAELKGGANDYEDFYCAGVEWEWGDGTTSETVQDCTPYAAGESEIKRRYIADHTYRSSGRFRVVFKLKRGNRVLTSSNTLVQVRPGIREGLGQ